MRTASSERRVLSLRTFDDLAAELDRIGAAIEAGTLGTTGGWKPGENMDHCATFLRCAIDGFPQLAPLPVRLVAGLLVKRNALKPGKPIPPGFKLPRQASFLLPEPGLDDRAGLARLRSEVERVRGGEPMAAKSPLLGTLTHEQWSVLQLKHAALHLGFLTGV